MCYRGPDDPIIKIRKFPDLVIWNDRSRCLSLALIRHPHILVILRACLDPYALSEV